MGSQNVSQRRTFRVADSRFSMLLSLEQCQSTEGQLELICCMSRETVMPVCVLEDYSRA